jgi:hypothetical protein
MPNGLYGIWDFWEDGELDFLEKTMNTVQEMKCDGIMNSTGLTSNNA